MSAAEPDGLEDVPLEDGERIVLRRYGSSGRPALALCHGNGFATDAYAPFWGPLAGRFDLFVFDLRHHGRNAPQNPDQTGIGRYADDLDRVYRAIRDLAPGVPLATGFHSLSAITALYHAARFAAPPDALILFDPPVQPPAGHALHDYARAFELKLADWSAGRPARFACPGELAGQFAKSRSLSGWVEGAHELMARAILREAGDNGWTLCCPPAVEAQNYRDNADLISWDLFENIAAPVVLIAGDPDHPARQSPARVCGALHEELGVERHMIRGTTHMLQLERPDACRDAFEAAAGRLLEC